MVDKDLAPKVSAAYILLLIIRFIGGNIVTLLLCLN